MERGRVESEDPGQQRVEGAEDRPVVVGRQRSPLAVEAPEGTGEEQAQAVGRAQPRVALDLHVIVEDELVAERGPVGQPHGREEP